MFFSARLAAAAPRRQSFAESSPASSFGTQDFSDLGDASPVARQTSVSGGGTDKPQVKWKQLVDNERTTFVPRLLEKHNELEPLQQVIIDAQFKAGMRMKRPEAGKRNEANVVQANVGTISGPLPHPYEVELQASVWGNSDFEIVEPQPFGRMEDTPLVYVSTATELRSMIEEIKATCMGKEIAVDVEHHQSRSFRGFVCLVQISTRHKDFIVDPFNIFREMHMLNEIFTDARIVKVLHGADLDVIWLQRDFSIYFVNLFDTGQATRTLHLQGGFSLANLVSLFCGVKLDKKWQTADWRQRPLSQEMLEYARCDTHYLLYCFDRLKNALLSFSGILGSAVPTETPTLATERGTQALEEVLDTSVGLARQLYVEKPFVPADEANRLFTRFGSKNRPMEEKHFGALLKLVKWRDRMARTLDESCNYVAPDACLWRIALVLPTTTWKFRAACNPLPPLVQQHTQELLEMLSRETPASEASPTFGTEEANVSTPVAAASPGAEDWPMPAPSPESVGVELAPLAFCEEWPVRRSEETATAPKPLVHVEANFGTKAAVNGGLFNTLCYDVASRDEEEVALKDGSDVIPVNLATKLQAIQDTMVFSASPPAKPSAVEKVLEQKAPAEPQAFDVDEVQEDEVTLDTGNENTELNESANQSQGRRKKRKRSSRGAGSCLESVVKSVVSDPYSIGASLLEDSCTLDKGQTEVPGGPSRKKKKGKKTAEKQQTTVDPYL